MTVRFMLATAALLSPACASLKASPDATTPVQCSEMTDPLAHQECMARVEEDSRDRREKQRKLRRY